MRLSRGALLAAAAAVPFASLPAVAQDSTPTVRIGCNATDLYLEPYIAQDAGFFARGGVTATITPFANGAANAQAVIAGAVDTGPADMIQIASAHLRGIPLAFYAGSGLYVSKAPTIVLCVAKTSDYAAPKDLAGGTIAVVALRSLTEVAMREWLRRNGVDAANVKLYEMPYAEMGPALVRGTVGAAFIGEPFLTAAKADVREIGTPNDAIASSFYLSAWFARREWIATNGDTVRRVRRAFYETARYANAHHDDTAAILAKYAKVQPELVRAMNRIAYATTLDPRQMQPVLDLAATYGLLDRRIAAHELIGDPS